MDDVNDTGQHADKSEELLQTAVSLFANHPDVLPQWYAGLSAGDLQMLSTAIGGILGTLNDMVYALRGIVNNPSPKLKREWSRLQMVVDELRKTRTP